MRIRRMRKWRVRMICLGAVLVLALSMLFGVLPLPNRNAPVTGVSLAPEKKLFQLGDQPSLLLHFQHAQEKTSWWHAALSARSQSVYAAGKPNIEISYDGKKAFGVSGEVKSQGQDFIVTIHSKDQLKPGTYTVQASGSTMSGRTYRESTTFAWGVLAINTTKSVYFPGETAQLQMAVLDSGGHTVCAAPLDLSVTDPNGSVSEVPYQKSDSCHGDSLNSAPDYSATYPTSVPGKYTMRLSIKGTAYSITDHFEVRTDVPFEVTRNTATRLYPVQGYSVDLRVVANQDFAGTITEIISDGRFKILDNGGATVEKSANDIKLMWHVSWKKGGHYHLSYQYFAPPVSPAFFTLGPLKFQDVSGRFVFQEARAWQLADDAAITFVKQTSATTSSSGATSLTGSVTSTAGNSIILIVEYNQNGVTISSVKDSTNGSGTSSDQCNGNDNGSQNAWICPEGVNAQDNPPINFASSTAAHMGIAYAVNAAAISNITVTLSASAIIGFNAIEFTNIDAANPVDQSASGYWGGSSHSGGTQISATTSTTEFTPTITATTCDNPTTDQLLRGGDYFCTSPNELIIGSIMTGGSNTQTLTTSGFTALTRVVIPVNTASAVGAYKITNSSGSNKVTWTLSSAANSSECIMAFRQNGNTSGGDEQSFFWAK